MEFTIENNFLCVRVQSRGAELCSVVKKETGEEMLWQADPAVWRSEEHTSELQSPS